MDFYDSILDQNEVTLIKTNINIIQNHFEFVYSILKKLQIYPTYILLFF